MINLSFRSNTVKIHDGRELPETIFGQNSSEYLQERMITIFMVDNGDWTISNALDDALAPTEDCPAQTAISMSEGTCGFIESMDAVPSGSSDVGTVLEVPSREDMLEFQRYDVISSGWLHLSS